jgi:DNA-binding HxlR family transcriptional regulator
VAERLEAPPRPTAVHRALDLIAERWTSLILREAYFGVRRFDEFQRGLGISRAILTDRLRRLVDAGIFERRPYRARPRRFEYRLTEAGLDLYPIFIAIKDWGERWVPEAGEARVRLRHRLCDHDTTARVVCAHCGEPLRAREVTYTVSRGRGR